MSLILIWCILSFLASGYLWGAAVVGGGPPRLWGGGTWDFRVVPKAWLLNPLAWGLVLQAWVFPGLFFFALSWSRCSVIVWLANLTGLTEWLLKKELLAFEPSSFNLFGLGALAVFVGIPWGMYRERQRISKDPQKLRFLIKKTVEQVFKELEKISNKRRGRWKEKVFSSIVRMSPLVKEGLMDISQLPSPISSEEFINAFRADICPRLKRLGMNEDLDQLLADYDFAMKALGTITID